MQYTVPETASPSLMWLLFLSSLLTKKKVHAESAVSLYNKAQPLGNGDWIVQTVFTGCVQSLQQAKLHSLALRGQCGLDHLSAVSAAAAAAADVLSILGDI